MYLTFSCLYEHVPITLRPDPPLGLDPKTTGSPLSSGLSATSTDAKKLSILRGR
jgi:hypothetical protein